MGGSGLGTSVGPGTTPSGFVFVGATGITGREGAGAVPMGTVGATGIAFDAGGSASDEQAIENNIAQYDGRRRIWAFLIGVALYRASWRAALRNAPRGTSPDVFDCSGAHPVTCIRRFSRKLDRVGNSRCDVG